MYIAKNIFFLFRGFVCVVSLSTNKGNADFLICEICVF